MKLIQLLAGVLPLVEVEVDTLGGTETGTLCLEHEAPSGCVAYTRADGTVAVANLANVRTASDAAPATT